MVQPQNSIGYFVEGDAAAEAMTFFFEIDFTSGYITKIVARRGGDLQIENFMRPSARLHICAMWPPEAHEFDTPALCKNTR